MIAIRRRPQAILLLLVLMLMGTSLVSIQLGSTRMSFLRVACALLGNGDWIDNIIIFDLRLPRIVISVLVGMGVATSGVILQGITRNDLAGPGTVGVNAGSGLGTMLLLAYSPVAVARQPWSAPAAAVGGAAIVTILVFGLAYRRGSVLPSRLLLVGIAVRFRRQRGNAHAFAADEFQYVQQPDFVDVGLVGCLQLGVDTTSHALLPHPDSVWLSAVQGN